MINDKGNTHYINYILDAPQDDGGSTITSYRVEICTNSGTHTNFILDHMMDHMIF